MSVANANPRMEEATIRKATLGDLEILSEMSLKLAATSSMDVQTERVRNGIAAAILEPVHGEYYLLSKKRICLGQFMVSPMWDDWNAKESWFIRRVFIRRNARGQGLLDRALEFVREKAIEAGVDSVQLVVHRQNQHAIRAYERRGLQFTGQRMVVPLDSAYAARHNSRQKLTQEPFTTHVCHSPQPIQNHA